jgi:DNA-binding LytR/AlgR family response regulator
LLKTDSKEEEGEHIFIKSNLKKNFIPRIKWIEAFGDYVRVVTEEDSNLVLSTMKAFENDLSKKFVRVHKSYIINIDKVERFNSKFAEIGLKFL